MSIGFPLTTAVLVDEFDACPAQSTTVVEFEKERRQDSVTAVETIQRVTTKGPKPRNDFAAGESTLFAHALRESPRGSVIRHAWNPGDNDR
jgi:hypothetical protein